MSSLKGKVALITGGSKGIGFGIAEALLHEGVNVAITSRKLSAAREAATLLNSNSDVEAMALGIEADVRQLESQQKAVQTVLEQFNQLDIVIANAGVGHFASIEELTPDQWHETIDTNLTGVYYTIKASVEALKEPISLPMVRLIMPVNLV